MSYELKALIKRKVTWARLLVTYMLLMTCNVIFLGFKIHWVFLLMIPIVVGVCVTFWHEQLFDRQ
jgi:hypothetical protein